MTENMRAINFDQPGDAEVLRVATLSKPSPKADEVLVEVAYAGVNRPDVFQRYGQYPPPEDASPILGLEVSGTVVAVGDGVEQWNIGDKVCGLCNGGGYAEYVVIPADQCLPVPTGLSMAQAASLPESFFTVWSNVVELGGLKAGDSFLVHGGSSGIGVSAIQIAKALGARVFTTAGSDEKCQMCERLGAELAVNYRQQDFVEAIRDHTQQYRIVDVILDMVGGDYVARNIAIAADDARIISIAFLRGAKVEVNLMPIMTRRIKLLGSTLRPRKAQYKAQIAQALQQQIWPLIEKGDIQPVIAAEFALEDAADAHRLMESNAHIGKIVLSV